MDALLGFLVEHRSVLQAAPLVLLPTGRELSKLLVPVGLEGVGNESVVRVDPEEASPGEFGLVLGALSGGLDNAATVLSELLPELDGERLAAVAATAPVSWAQRLGYLLDFLGAPPGLTDSLAAFVRSHSKAYVPLATRVRRKDGERDQRWRVVVNTGVHPEA